MPMQNSTVAKSNFSSISLSVASPEEIKGWSHGEVTKPETINYRTQKPELDGLFCERIFGPTKNWECYCGKYKRIRYKGIVCEKCGVEVTRSVVRRERMGHISLAVPVVHIWYLRSTPSRIGLLLDLPIRLLEQIVYFASYVVIDVDDEAKKESLESLDAEYKSFKKKIHDEQTKISNEIRVKMREKKATQKDLDSHEAEYALKLEELHENHQSAKKELQALERNTVLSELEYREMNMKFGHVFQAGTGAESIRKLLEGIDLNTELDQLEKEREQSTGQRQKKLLKRIRFLSFLKRAGIRPEWMILTELPIIPPDLRPMVQLDGGRFAASDLNDLYRRIINRNNRLKRLASIGAPESYVETKKECYKKQPIRLSIILLVLVVLSLLQVIDENSEVSPICSKGSRVVSDKIFSENVSTTLVVRFIVVGPQLLLHQCGLPKEMAMKLFKPFVIGELIRREYAHNVKSAERLSLPEKK
jgi:DNA-directed RNA polymerase subunit beta'